MSDPIAEQEVIQQVDLAEQATEASTPEQGETGNDEMAAIEAGYNKPTAQEAQQEPRQEGPAQAIPRMIAGIPEEELVVKLKKIDEFEASLNERLQKVNNLLGNMKQRMDAIPKDAPKTEMRAITADSMKKLRELGFDDLAEALAEDLSGAMSVSSAPQIDVSEVISKAMRETAEKDLDDLHPDWRQLAETNTNGEYVHPGFSSWVSTLDPGVQEKVRTTQSAAFASRVFEAYKTWEAEKADSEVRARKTSESRLQNAMTPTQGKTASPPSKLPDEAGLWDGYNKGPKPFRRQT